MTLEKISLLMPTRDRFDLANTFIKSLEKNTLHPNKVELLIYVDKDDKKSQKLKSRKIPTKVYVGEKLTMGKYNTFLYKKSSGELIMLVNDDIKVLTVDWDLKIRKLYHKFSDKIFLGYPNDLFKKKSLCTFPIISKKTAQKLIKPFPVEYNGAFIDLHLFDVFKGLEKNGFNRIVYLDDVIFEHTHYRTGKSEFDETYKKRDRFQDDKTFHNLVNLRRKQSENLKKSILQKSLKLDLNLKKNNLNKFQIIISYLFDKRIPVKWRFYLTSYFIARNIYKFFFNR